MSSVVKLQIFETNCADTYSPTPSLLVAQRPSTYSKGNMGKFGQGLEVKWEKVACWSTKAAISLIRVNIMRKSYYGGPTGTHQRSFERYHPRPARAPLHQDRAFATPNPQLKSLLSQELQIWSEHSQGPSIRTKAH